MILSVIFNLNFEFNKNISATVKYHWQLFIPSVISATAICMKTKHFLFIFYFFVFWRKPSILIPDLYLYSIKIQTNIHQNAVKNIRENHKCFEKIFGFFWAGSSSAHVAGLDPAGFAGSLAQTSDPAGFYPPACVNKSRTLAAATM